MAKTGEILVGLDIGTTKICAIVAESVSVTVMAIGSVVRQPLPSFMVRSYTPGAVPVGTIARHASER